MDLRIFNVGQAFCALLTADNGNNILFDCGSNDDLGFRPSTVLPGLGVTRICELVITNFDADHVSDLHNLQEKIPIELLTRNPTLPPANLAQIKLKTGPMTKGLSALVGMLGNYTETNVVRADYGGIEISLFWNPYPAFADTNSLSLVSFIEYDGLSIVIPGDLTAKGWTALLAREDFRRRLSRVNIFVASHHGREDGYCEAVFEHCRPQVVIISDGPIQYDTQEHCYDEEALGIPWSQAGVDSVRYVLTTRTDGSLLVSKTKGQAGYITTFHVNSLISKAAASGF